MKYEKLLPGVIIGLIVLYALSKLKGGSSPQVYNALLPSSTDKPENRDAARVAGFSTLASVGLGQLKLTEQGSEAAQAVDLAKQRFASTLDLARINNEGAFNRLTAQLTDRNYDRQLQQRALDQTFALAASGQATNGVAALVNSILSAVRGSAGQSQARPGSSGSTPPVSSPPFNPNAARQPARPGSMNGVTAWLNRYFNAPLRYQNYPDLGYVPPREAYDWSAPWDFGDSQLPLTNADMLTGVGSYPIESGSADWWTNLYGGDYANFNEWYNTEFGA